MRELNALQRLHAEHDQSPWLDFVDRELVESGRLRALVDAGIRGLTSNPTIFAKAVATGQYEELIASSRRSKPDELFEEIAVQTVGAAADVLRPVYERSSGEDGYASIEVEPALADDVDATLARARHLWRRLDRPNVYIKIPATDAGIRAIEQAVGEGININVTLIFSVEVYRRVAEAYLAGLRSRQRAGLDIGQQASVASFFVSRIDTKVDALLDQLDDPDSRRLRGWTAIANAKRAYTLFTRLFDGPAFDALRAGGARVQRPLWASTGTKGPAYRDTLYVEELIGPRTVTTMPLATIEAVLDHGQLRRTLDVDLGEAEVTRQRLAAAGINLDRVTSDLLDEGLAAFRESVTELLAAISDARVAAGVA